MKVLLIEPYSIISESRKLVPVGIPYIGAYLRQQGHVVEGYNANVSGRHPSESTREIIRQIEENNYDVVGMGGLCMAFPYQMELYDAFAQMKDRPVLVSGGNMFTSEPEFCMDEYRVDFGIFGEGEIPFAQLLETLESGGDVSKVGGIYYRDNGAIKSTAIPGEAIKDLDTLPFPAYDLFYSDEEIKQQSAMSIYTSRSCPFNCSFCYHPVGSRYRRRSVENVISEIEFMYEKYGFTGYYFGDELFLADDQWVLDFCDQLDALPFFDHWSCQTRATHVQPHLLKRIQQSGCTHVRVGIESGSDTVLKSMNKKTTRADNVRAVKNIREAGMNMDGGIIIGDFEETPETLKETIEFIKEVNLAPNQVINFIIPFPGAPIWYRCLEEGLIKDKRAFIESLANPAKLRVNMTRMSDDELLALQEWGAQEILTHFATTKQVRILEAIELDDNNSQLTIECPECGGQQSFTFRNMSLDTIHFCSHCKVPTSIHPLDIPHFKRRSQHFMDAVAKIEEDGPRDILVTPSCLDFIRLNAIGSVPLNRIKGFLDMSGPKTENDYFGLPVHPRTKENAIDSGAKQLFIVSADYCKPIFDEVSKWDIPDLEIIPLYE